MASPMLHKIHNHKSAVVGGVNNKSKKFTLYHSNGILRIYIKRWRIMINIDKSLVGDALSLPAIQRVELVELLLASLDKPDISVD